jgi:hypothetical protein
MGKIIFFLICVAIISLVLIAIINWVRTRVTTQIHRARNFFNHGYQRWVWLAVAIILGWIFFIENPSIKSSEDNGGSNYTPPPVYTAPVLSSQLFNFDSTRVFSVYLKRGWKTYPKNGAISITTPDGKVINDTPGVNLNVGCPPEGNYTFRATEKSTTAVEIYNYW